MQYSRAQRLAILSAACQHIADGSTVNKAAALAGTTRQRLWEWSRDDPEMADLYTRARLTSAWAYDDEALEVARASTPETAASDRVRIDTLKWAAAKRRPKEYGDRVEHEVSGTVGHLHLAALQAPKQAITASATVASDVTRITQGTENPGVVSPTSDTSPDTIATVGEEV